MFEASTFAPKKQSDRSNKPPNSPLSHHAILSRCARVVPIDDTLFRAEVECITDWDQLLAAANFHGLTALLAAAIETACPDAVPADVLRGLNDSKREAIALNLLFSNELARLLAVLNRQGISALPLKGPILAESLYTNPALRPCSDLDILVRPQDVPEVLRILQREEYELEPYLARLPVPALLDWDIEVPLRHGQGTRVDLHWAIAPRDNPLYFDADVLWNSIRPARLCGKDVCSVAPEVLLVFLCVHGTKHMWSRLVWLADIDRLTRPNLEWAEAFGLANRVGCERPLLLGLLLAHEKLDAVIPEPYLERARAERTVGSLVEQVMRLHGRTHAAHPSSLEVAIFFVGLADRRWDGARHCAALLRAPSSRGTAMAEPSTKVVGPVLPFAFGSLNRKYGIRDS